MIEAATLPIRPLPVDGESFGSYIDRVAAERDVPVTVVLAATGLSESLSPVAMPSNYGVFLTERALARAARALRLDEEDIQGMLFRRYDGVAFDMPRFSDRLDLGMQVFAGREWVYLRQSSACPECLREDGGAWQLAWRLPFVFACVRHNRLLASDCPACRMPLGSTRETPTIPYFARFVPRLWHCGNPVAREDGGYGRLPCGHDLTKIKTPSLSRWPRLSKAQAVIDAALGGEAQVVGGQTLTPREYLHDVRLLAGLMLHVAKAEDLGRLPADQVAAFVGHEEARERDNTSNLGNRKRRFIRATPESAALMAAVIPRAVEMLTAPTQAEVAEEIVWLITRSRSVRGRSLDRMPTAVKNSSTLLPIWREAADSLTFSMRYHHRRPRRHEFQFEPRHVPQLIWPDVYRRRFADLAPAPTSELAMRRFCSLELVRFGGGLSRVQAAKALDLPPGISASASAIALRLRRAGQLELFLSRLRRVGQELHASDHLVDYDRRRSMLLDLSEIPWDEWCLICDASEVEPGKPHAKHRYAAVWLWEVIAGGDYREAAGLRGRPLHHRATYAKTFVERQLPPLEAALRRFGEQFVHERVERNHRD